METVEPGRRVGERLTLVRLLGSGAMGDVWVARHETLDTEVAVKFIHGDVADNPEVAARFEREAKAAAHLRSPHVVQIFDHGAMDDGTAYLVMELLDGESLDDRLDREPQLPPPLCSDVVTQTARALSAAHGAGIVHRDIKPGNVFLCAHGDGVFVKLLDFGIARVEDATLADRKLTQSGVLIGTPTYMSREQIVSPGPVDHRADLWALAVLAYEMLTGDVPFTGETVGQICVSVAQGRPAPIAERLGLPSAVDDFFARAFDEDIDARFQSASAQAEAFAAALENDAPERAAAEPVEVQPPSPEPPARDRDTMPKVEVPAERGRKRRAWPWALAAVAIAGVVVAIAQLATAPGPPAAGAPPKDDEPPAEPTSASAAPSAVAPEPQTTELRPETEPAPEPTAEPSAAPPPAPEPTAEPNAAAHPPQPSAPPGAAPLPPPPPAPPPPEPGREDYGF